MFDKVEIKVEETDVDRLLSEYLVTEFAEALSDFEGGDDSIVMREFVTNFVWSFSSKPFVGPGFEIKITVFNSFIITLLKLADEVSEICVSPFEFLEVKLQTMGKCVPTHKENELFQQTGSFSISNTINERLRNISIFALSFDVVVSSSQII